MAQTIKIKRSGTSGNKLTGSNSIAGEIGMNTADKSLYIQTGSADADVVTVYDDSILHLDDTNNRVGIGTTSPQATLDVIGTGKFRGSSADDGVVLALGQMESPNSTTPLFEFRTNDVGTDQLEIRGRRYEAITRFSRGSAAGAGVSMAVLQRSFPGADVHGTAFSLFEQADSSASGSTATTVKIRLDSSGSSYFNGGNVGIGTTAPANSLEIATSNPTIRLRDTDTGARTTLSAASGVGGFILNVDSGNSVANSYIDFKLDNTTRMYVNGSGNVGIGTAAPSYKIDVAGTGRISNGLYFNNASSGGFIYETNAQPLRLGTNNSERMRIDADGRLLINTTSSIDNTARLQIVGNSSGYARITMQDADGTNQKTFFDHSNGLTSLITQNNTSNGSFSIRGWNGTTTTDFVRVHNNGQLGIGVTVFTNALRGSGRQLIIGSCFVGTAAALVADDFARFGGGLYIHEDAGTNKANVTSIDNDGDRLVITGKGGTTANALSAPDGFYIGSTQFITSSRNLVNIGTISSGAITTSGTLDFTANPAYIRNDQDNSGQIIISSKNSSGSAQQVRWDAANASSGAWRPEVTNVSNLGLTNRIWNTLYVNNIRMGSGNNQFVDASRNITAGTISSGNITTTGYLRGPSTFTIDPAAHGDNSGTVVIAGNLQVDGTTTTINSTTMTVDDKNITLASGSTNKAAANGAGLTVDCGSDTDATFTYDGTNDEWDFNKALNVTGGIEASGPSAFKYGLTSSVTGNTSEYPLDIGSTGATNFVIQRWQTNYGYKSFIIAYGSQHSSQAGNFAIKNTQTGKDIYFQLANSVEPLRLTSTGATFAGTISSGAITATGTSTLSGLSINSAFTFPTSDGSTNQVLKTDGSGNVTWATEAATSASTSMSDADGDTKIQVEESADEDLIRFDVAGTERFRIGSDVQVMGTTDFNITGSNRRINFTSGTGTVRTSGASSLNLGTSNTDRMTITSAGNVGIGTTSPETKLDVIVDSNSAYTSTMSGVPSYTPSASDVIQVKNTESGVDNIYAGIWFETGNPATNTTGSDRTGRIALVVDNDTSYASNFVFQTRGSAGTLTEKMRITEGGNVGIGATNPSNQFVIKSGTGVDMEFGSEPTAAFIQTYNRTSSAYGHLRFVTNGETMRLTNTGSVGIGTTSPSQKLQVAGTILADTALTASSSTTAIGIGSESNISDGNSTYKTKLITENNNAKLTTYQYGSYLTLKAGVSGTGYSNNWSKIELRDGGAAGSNNAHMKFYTHGDERMVIDTNGNVGIGTTSPIAPLHITNSSTSTPTLLLGKNQTNGVTLLGDDYISGENYVTLGMDYSSNSLMLGAAVKVSSTASRTLVSSQDGYAAKGAAIYVDGYGGAIDFYTSNSSAVRTTGAENTNIANRMRIDSAGNVGIGYSSPNYKLDISATGNGINLGGTGAFLRWNSGDMQIKNEGSYAMGFYTYNSSDAALNRRMIIDTNGNVGIGTTSPSQRLSVRGATELSVGDTGSGHGTEFNWVKSNTGSNGNGVWYKVADISLPAASFSAMSFEAYYETGLNNFGSHNYLDVREVFVSIVRNSTTTINNSPDNAVLKGRTQDIRVYKTAAGTYELQARHASQNAKYAVRVRMFQTNGGTITPKMDGTTAGTTSGGTEYTVETAETGAVGIKHFVGQIDPQRIHLGNVDLYPSGNSNYIHLSGSGFIPSSTTASSNGSLGTSTYLWNGVFSRRFQGEVGTAGVPTFTFTEDSNTGMYDEWYVQADSKRQLSFTVDGTRRMYLNEAGLWSAGNFYLPSNGASLRSFYTYTEISNGTSGNGFRMRNSADNVDSLIVTSAGNGTFAGSLTVNGKTNTNSLLVENPSTVGHTAIGTISNDADNAYVRSSIIMTRDEDQITYDSSTNNWTHAGGGSTDWSMITHTANDGFQVYSGPAVSSSTNYTNTAFNNAYRHFQITSGGKAFFYGNVEVKGTLQGPSTFTIDPAAHGDDTGTVVIAGNLQVDGTTTTINSTTLTVDDKNITLASGAANAAAANGAGITVDTVNAQLTYDATQDRWNMNKGLELISTPLVVGTGSTDVGRVETSSGIFSLTAYTTRQIAFGNDTNGEHVRIDADGRLLINTTSSIDNTARLQIVGNSSGLARITMQDADGTNQKTFFDHSNGLTSLITQNNTSNGSFSIRGWNGTTTADFVRVDSNGKVGIGTTNPLNPLYIKQSGGSHLFALETSYASDRTGRGQISWRDSGNITGGIWTEYDGTNVSMRFGNLYSSGYNTNTSMIIRGNGNVGIGTINPSLKLVVDSGSVNHVAQFKSTDNSAQISIADNDTTVYVSAENARGSFGFYTGTNTSNLNITSNGNVGIGTNNLNAKLNVEELGIDTTTTSTTATTQVAIDTFAAATFRSAKYTIQVTNSTDSTYHITEILLIHDGTTPGITEYGTVFTGSAEATFDADISSGNVRLLATPASADSMTFKVVRHCITV